MIGFVSQQIFFVLLIYLLINYLLNVE